MREKHKICHFDVEVVTNWCNFNNFQVDFRRASGGGGLPLTQLVIATSVLELNDL